MAVLTVADESDGCRVGQTFRHIIRERLRVNDVVNDALVRGKVSLMWRYLTRNFSDFWATHKYEMTH
ncbi:hypothetical protein TcasGA2_TC000657 [Tribolium castaneum]|uniref:Uncharacterized protein n=1 Tax=Tribolium castaneum TaxID=7070 RepID=D6W914_TRICA|nr:hypothetical protein TcasGA2_TC000657 [Tribolium castaneum]